MTVGDVAAGGTAVWGMAALTLQIAPPRPAHGVTRDSLTVQITPASSVGRPGPPPG
ncbi:hypothetical protein [Streptosporangium carneum]|uniref:Uncharacterized protein n=1 Tax=Streptosporangium carneum TaxID=47481 RepID=A0A9W6MFB0_9ACTN|nr:hypothetical protein [Streptosporangium carneum]GLK12071.1 hypothetical protein GCM10017600_54790 [Streptosporangium carneum]